MIKAFPGKKKLKPARNYCEVVPLHAPHTCDSTGVLQPPGEWGRPACRRFATALDSLCCSHQVIGRLMRGEEPDLNALLPGVSLRTKSQHMNCTPTVTVASCTTKLLFIILQPPQVWLRPACRHARRITRTHLAARRISKQCHVWLVLAEQILHAARTASSWVLY
jgi:hypothetical protein